MSRSELFLLWDSSPVNYIGWKKKIHLSGSKDKILLLKNSTIPTPTSFRVGDVLHFYFRGLFFVHYKYHNCNLAEKIKTKPRQ